jgi:hypothetical protein
VEVGVRGRDGPQVLGPVEAPARILVVPTEPQPQLAAAVLGPQGVDVVKRGLSRH